MQTECSAEPSAFGRSKGRPVMAAFNGGALTSDAGGSLGAADRRLNLVRRLAGCFRDARDPRFIEHSVATLIGRRMYGIALGYEDLNDHDELRHDPLMAVLAGKLEAKREDCAPVAGKSTLNRLELSREIATRYKKISHDGAAIEALFVDLFLEAHDRAPREIVLDLDATDDPLHGHQEAGSSTATTTAQLSAAVCVLRPASLGGQAQALEHRRQRRIGRGGGADRQANSGALAEDARPVARQLGLRPRGADGLVRDEPGRLRVRPGAQCAARRGDRREAAEAEAEAASTGKAARRYKDFRYATLDSWSRRRRVIGKAEWTKGEANPRFIVTSLSRVETNARFLYEKVYCARGDMENRIKECQGDLFADRTSTPPCAPTSSGSGTVTLSLNGRCRTADRDQKVMRKGLHLSRCSKRSTLRLVHDAFHLQTVDPGDDETGWRSDRGWREISEHAALF